jgi:hypothetical protein
MDMHDHGFVSTGRSFLLSGGMRGPIRVYVGAPPPGASGRPVPPYRLASDLLAWMMAGAGADYYALLEIYKEVNGSFPHPPGPSDLRQMADHLVDAFARARLVALEPLMRDVAMLHTPSNVDESPPLSQPSPPTLREERPVTTWIELVLVDEEGMPVPNRRFSLILPDETVREGVFDAKGCVHLEGIDPGMCKLTFPDLDVSTFA